mmetsp:Transcript_22486/g.42453  ORF Transcript_22486/g.42453 Transcript_22486/m.42453 type:complete len:438 (-) Transcript_22486:237-1550(-)
MHRFHHLLASLQRGVVGAVSCHHARHHLAHRGAVHQSLQQACAGESISSMQSRARRLSGGVQVAIPSGAAIAPTVVPHDAPVQIGRHAPARVMRGGNDGNAILGEIHGYVPRRQVGLNRGEPILQPLGVSVGDVQVGVVLPIIALLILQEDGARDYVPRGELAVGMVIFREGPSVKVAEYGTLAAQCLGEEESRLVGEEERCGVKLHVFQVGYDAIIVVVGIARTAAQTILQAQCQTDARSQGVESQWIRRVLINASQSATRQNDSMHGIIAAELIGLFIEDLGSNHHIIIRTSINTTTLPAIILIYDQVRHHRIAHKLNQRMLARRLGNANRNRLPRAIRMVNNPRSRMRRLQTQTQHVILAPILLVHRIIIIVLPRRREGGPIERHHTAVRLAQSLVLLPQKELTYARGTLAGELPRGVFVPVYAGCGTRASHFG